ncbi:MAG TPA: T9SS type A sorting domain-containing protein [Flavipsychrobacter sp.]|nr:T9SS type A sorting domain-containing protein [Flavipsychrobacter sp.]
MKTILFAIAILLTTAIDSVAQQNENCKIYYNYDAAGQRVKRYHHCLVEGEDESVAPPILVNLFPNPTNGPVNVMTNELVDVLTVRVFDMEGHEIVLEDCHDCNSLTIDLSGQLTGTYVVNVNIVKQGYTDQQQSFTVIRYAD